MGKHEPGVHFRFKGQIARFVVTRTSAGRVSLDSGDDSSRHDDRVDPHSPRHCIELLYFPGCPNVAPARVQLQRTLIQAGLPAQWEEHDVSADDAPLHTRGYGSPTILVDGRDVSGGSPTEGSACRLYPGSEVPGVPPQAAILGALGVAPGPGGLAGVVAAAPGVILSALPIVACPSCWPAYGSVLGALGVPFLMDFEYLLPLTVIALLIALVGLGWRVDRRRGLAPLGLGVVASACILAGKFAFDLPIASQAGTALLVGAVLWKAWRGRAARRACTTCPTPASL